MTERFKHRLINDEVWTHRKLHTFTMGDVDDLDIYIAQPIYEWQQTEHGSWVMSHAKELEYFTMMDHSNFGYRVAIMGYVKDRDWTEYCLKFAEYLDD